MPDKPVRLTDNRKLANDIAKMDSPLKSTKKNGWNLPETLNQECVFACMNKRYELLYSITEYEQLNKIYF
jgi:hypothetical protein